MAEYGKVYKKIWRNEKFRCLTEDEQALFLYLITSPHSNLLGIYLIAVEYMAADKNWKSDRTKEALDGLTETGFLKYDESRCVILIPSWFEHNTLTSPNQLKKALAELSEVPKTPLLLELKAILNAMPNGILDAIADAIPNAVPNGIADGVPLAVPNSEAVTETEAVTEIIPYGEILGHLFQLTGKKFQEKAESNRKWIRARWRDGFRLDDFLYVNQVKAEEWLATEREMYLRPKTLYSVDHFEGYRQQRRVVRQYSEQKTKALIAAANWLKQGGYQVDPNGQTQIDSRAGQAPVDVS